MTNMRKDHDDKFEDFLQRRDELSRLLQSLPQPQPTAALDAAILEKAEAELANKDQLSNTAANDPAMPGASKTPPRLLNRWRTPIALAASVLCSLALLMHWQAGTDSTSPIMVAQAPQPETSVPTMRADDTPTAPLASAPQASQASGETGKDRGNGGASEATQAVRRQEMVQDKPGSDSRVAPLPHEAGKDTPPPTQIARALLPDDLPARTAAPAPASTAAAPQADEHTPAAAAAPANPEKAKAWIKLIEELIKADLRQDALTEWEKFRQAYPRYPAPEKLEAQIRALKK